MIVTAGRIDASAVSRATARRPASAEAPPALTAAPRAWMATYRASSVLPRASLANVQRRFRRYPLAAPAANAADDAAAVSWPARVRAAKATSVTTVLAA